MQYFVFEEHIQILNETLKREKEEQERQNKEHAKYNSHNPSNYLNKASSMMNKYK